MEDLKDFKISKGVKIAIIAFLVFLGAVLVRVRNSFYKISKKLNIGLLFYLLICYNSIKEVTRND